MKSQTFCLNAPYGARCFLTRRRCPEGGLRSGRLNAPYGARCFLTRPAPTVHLPGVRGLNAPYGARSFLTLLDPGRLRAAHTLVLIRLMALGAF